MSAIEDQTVGTPVGDLASPDVLILPQEVQKTLSDSDDSLGTLGRPFDRRNPFFVGLAGAFGVGVAYVVFQGIGDITSVLIIVGLALFIAIGLNPIIDLLMARSLSGAPPSPWSPWALSSWSVPLLWWPPLRSPMSSTPW